MKFNQITVFTKLCCLCTVFWMDGKCVLKETECNLKVEKCTFKLETENVLQPWDLFSDLCSNNYPQNRNSSQLNQWDTLTWRNTPQIHEFPSTPKISWFCEHTVGKEKTGCLGEVTDEKDYNYWLLPLVNCYRHCRALQHRDGTHWTQSSHWDQSLVPETESKARTKSRSMGNKNLLNLDHVGH